MTDARFTNHGSLIGIVPITLVAKAWIDEHVDAEAYQWFDALCRAALCAHDRHCDGRGRLDHRVGNRNGQIS